MPFALIMDKWRWAIYAGEITQKEYNLKWWQLREKYQGIKAPVERSADGFDAGHKYHIPENVPYIRYFLI